MSTAIEIIHKAYNAIGVHSFVQPADPSLISDALPVLITALETLRKNDIILEETVADVTTTIAVPTVLTSALQEPAASTMHLYYYLSADLAPLARVPQTLEMLLAKQRSYTALAQMYRQAATPKIVPSSHLPLGQGSQRGPKSRTFFGGVELEDDTSTTA